jgi:hypothetical protein
MTWEFISKFEAFNELQDEHKHPKAGSPSSGVKVATDSEVDGSV